VISLVIDPCCWTDISYVDACVTPLFLSYTGVGFDGTRIVVLKQFSVNYGCFLVLLALGLLCPDCWVMFEILAMILCLFGCL
jgi:hypothetical protein